MVGRWIAAGRLLSLLPVGVATSAGPSPLGELCRSGPSGVDAAEG
jgi:hypothetical protein